MDHSTLHLKGTLVFASAILLAGCSMFGGGGSGTDPSGTTSGGTTTQPPPVVDVGTYDSGTMGQGTVLPDDQAGDFQNMSLSDLKNANVVYFDFDAASLRSDVRQLLFAHANFLRRNGSIEILIAGHADERGTREYNMALGEKRALVVRSFLIANGVDASRLDVVSYGEEKPANFSGTESGWSQNRRAELIYP